MTKGGHGGGKGPNTTTSKTESKNDQVIDFNEARANKLEEKRRKTERVFFRNLLSVYSVLGGSKLAPIEIVDISEDGIAFQVPFTAERPWPVNEEIMPMRLYFSQDTYIEIFVNIQNSRPAIEDGQRYTRFGCAVDKGTKSYPAFQQFVQFMKSYAEHSHKDLGDVSVFYL